MALFRGHKASLSRYTTSPYPFSYHVFLSFRGEDTRKNFADHLYTALVNAGFHTFRDDGLEKGENIKQELANAIRESRTSVIVFSKDYASSRWCLEELVTILERKRTSNHFVLPVFYDVDPSHLRNQTASVAETFTRHQKTQSSSKVRRWRAALKQVADLAGMDLQNEADGHESKFIQKIVGVIRDKLGRVPLSDVQKELEDKLLSVNPVLDDAEGKQLKFQTTVKPWLHKLKEAVYEAEDLLQEIKTQVLRQKKNDKYGSSTSKVQELISTPSHAFDSALIYSRVDEVLEKLDNISKQTKDVLDSEVTTGHRVSQPLPSISLVEKSVYGRDEEKERLVKLLLSDDETGNETGVIPIVGMGGIGKTTLAQFVYNDVRVKQHFHLQAWVCVSKEFDVFRISQHIYESLTTEACQSTNLDLLLSKLQATLMGKRFFFVLDDIWNKNYNQLELLRRPLESGAHGSKIIVTTRDENVARMMGSLKAHSLMPMSEEDSWSLFEKHALKNGGVPTHSHLEKIGRQIVRKCNGLPLAIKSLGGLLCSKLLVEEWESILNSDMWEFSLDESDILPSLWLSYLDLPLHLKRCFAYCSLYPKNYKFQKSELIYLWKAEDLLQHKKNKMAEEVGQDYFNDLISRSFFQHSSSSDEYFTMHDLINDLASFVSGEFYFRWEGTDSPNSLSKTRHFSYMSRYHDEADSLAMFEALQQAKCLRTFLSLKPRWWLQLNKGRCDILPKSECLRVLKLYAYNIEELPDSIHNFKHLTYLDLSATPIKKLTDTICTLYNLQVLLLSNCRGLIELPAKLRRLINLSHLDITKTKLKKMPPQMGRLKDLQMLPEFVLDKHTAGDNLAELKKLEKLRGRLRISGLVHSSGLEAYILRDKKFLKELVLDWGRRHVFAYIYTVEEREVLEKLQPHLNLERLTIKGYGGKMFSGWSEYYPSSALGYLELVDCVNCISLPPLGQLPSLRELHISKLHGVVSVGSEFYYGDGNTSSVNKPFRSLRSLKFDNMSGWKDWSYGGGDDNEGGVFPNLVHLEVIDCPNLTGRLVSDSLPSLVSLTVLHCPELECFPEDGFLSKLKSLEQGKVNAKSIQNLNKGLRTLTSLERLTLEFSCDEKVDWFVEEQAGMFPSILTYLTICRLNCETINGAKWFGNLNSLQELEIWNCPALRCLPNSGLPSSLQRLQIWRCPALQCLPDSGLPSSLTYLCIHECPLLEKRCQRETGEDWPKIAHIKCISIR
ncbi:putative TIR domain, P-loop containing nucleoside triphosphate hydrolase [Rosa chinensis]|uniref:Putative TIR domain, P-loop containing nucleoside triphosphate hydrolase n=1 Tax=Rosa chinensis TaxID=74649 RepID=A0A2P6SAW4_ROSCH|nr:putative disease resistance RPP13-like protein 1 [Rosa chinensis]XP_024176510.1 putative disease resistance RPP13-like protein 1 [Rosa chinensis]XP_024176511.1 putative disease resistance RPP13-like protein 1 [Rosa chinensis]XP_024176512.1 putative disease resistance RPP13-like protein 1 [Rosa chinensis]XP_024176513.1 putative disease resistance RPP13-like protein 1 [Rosa chinensis]XP_024176514.1 putative disease resistance RPP13-like protein 1 [Rosa chinensis]XP_024176515.1 putative disea